MLWSYRDETAYYITSECRKLAQKEYKTRHDWVGLVINWELCKEIKFGHTGKWYMHKTESVLENVMMPIVVGMVSKYLEKRLKELKIREKIKTI